MKSAFSQAVFASIVLANPYVGASAGPLEPVRLDRPGVLTIMALHNEIDVTFDNAFAREHMINTAYDSVVVESIEKGKICLMGRRNELREGNPQQKVKTDYDSGLFCTELANVSARIPQAHIMGRPPVYNSRKPNCQWRWVSGDGIGTWAEDCTYEQGSHRIVFDHKAGAFVMPSGGGKQDVVLQAFDLYSGGVAELLSRLKATGRVTNDEDCVIVPVQRTPVPAGWSVWVIGLKGEKGQEESSAAYHNDEFEGPACGALSDYGFHMDRRYFVLNETNKSRIYFVNARMGSPQIDPFSVTP